MQSDIATMIGCQRGPSCTRGCGDIISKLQVGRYVGQPKSRATQSTTVSMSSTVRSSPAPWASIRYSRSQPFRNALWRICSPTAACRPTRGHHCPNPSRPTHPQRSWRRSDEHCFGLSRTVFDREESWPYSCRHSSYLRLAL